MCVGCNQYNIVYVMLILGVYAYSVYIIGIECIGIYTYVTRSIVYICVYVYVGACMYEVHCTFSNII